MSTPTTTLAAMNAALASLGISPAGTPNGNARPGMKATASTGEKSPRLITRRPSSAPQTVTPTVTKEIPPVNTNGTAIATAPSAAPATDLQAELARLQAENAALRASKKPRATGMKIGEKGGLSVYGLGRFPVTLYKEQWEALLDMEAEIRAFMKAHAAELKVKS